MRKTKFSLREKVVFSLRTHSVPHWNTPFSSQEYNLFLAGQKRYESLNIWGKEGGASKVVLKT